MRTVNEIQQWDEIERLSYIERIGDNKKSKPLDLKNYKTKFPKYGKRHDLKLTIHDNNIKIIEKL